jgi:hypothetical protein
MPLASESSGGSSTWIRMVLASNRQAAFFSPAYLRDWSVKSSTKGWMIGPGRWCRLDVFSFLVLISGDLDPLCYCVVLHSGLVLYLGAFTSRIMIWVLYGFRSHLLF